MMWDDLAGLEWEAQRTSPDILVRDQGSLPMRNDVKDPPVVPVRNASTPELEVRMALILRLRAEIAAGTYYVPLEQLAEKMLDRARRQRRATKDMYSV